MLRKQLDSGSKRRNIRVLGGKRINQKRAVV